MFFPFLFIVYDALIDCHTDTTIAKKNDKRTQVSSVIRLTVSYFSNKGTTYSRTLFIKIEIKTRTRHIVTFVLRTEICFRRNNATFRIHLVNERDNFR